MAIGLGSENSLVLVQESHEKRISQLLRAVRASSLPEAALRRIALGDKAHQIISVNIVFVETIGSNWETYVSDSNRRRKWHAHEFKVDKFQEPVVANESLISALKIGEGNSCAERNAEEVLADSSFTQETELAFSDDTSLVFSLGLNASA